MVSPIDNIVPYTGVLTEAVASQLASLPPGVVGIASGFLGRYREFDRCLESLWLPPNSLNYWALGVDVCHNFNESARLVLKDPELQWLWILGDDHVFTQDLFLKLWERDVDIVVPLCLRSNGDNTPILNESKEYRFGSIINGWEEIKGKSGLMEWRGLCGNAGMLIRRNVLEKMEQPWFRAGQLSLEYSSSDLYFCHVAKEDGFKIHIDLDNVIGHITHVAVWPRRDENGDWFVDMRKS